MPGRILLVDDERALVRGLVASLRQAGYEVVPAYEGEEAWARFQETRPDLVLLDLMLPGTDGLTLCRRIRQAGRTPVIMLTARSDDVDKVLGLELGADDYITKPFNTRELLARVKAVLRRSQPQPGAGADLRCGHVTVHPGRQEVWCHGRPVVLTPREYDLLAFLLSHPDRVYSREALLEQVWGYDFPGDGRTVDVHIRRLREKLEDDPAQPTLIRTRWGKGYYVAEAGGPGAGHREEGDGGNR